MDLDPPQNPINSSFAKGLPFKKLHQDTLIRYPVHRQTDGQTQAIT